MSEKLTHIVHYKYQQRSLQNMRVQKMRVEPKFVELTADVLEIILYW